jgi:hypothetical protein
LYNSQSGNPFSSFSTGKHKIVFHAFLNSAETILLLFTGVFANVTIVFGTLFFSQSIVAVQLIESFQPIAAILNSVKALRVQSKPA